MSLADLLDALRLSPAFMSNVAVWERLPPRPARYADFPANLDRRLVDLLRRANLAPLYTHQAQAIESALAGENVLLVAGTASGKSLAYHVPALQALLVDPTASILYLFPTKALAQDQAQAIGRLVAELDAGAQIPLNIYDGDTPQSQRTRIRSAGGIIISNPDMLHMGILPYHTRWVDFLSGLKLVVLDEIHTYRGVFGSHMANVLRRLRRICRFHGSDPLFICTSATIGNPGQFAEQLLEAPVTVIDDDGSPRGEKHIVFYNPPMLDPVLGIRRSYLLETRDIAGQLLVRDIQTITFARARMTTEVLLSYVRDEAARQGKNPESVRGYRGGYLPTQRREIEHGLREGVVRGVVATNALELGIDIGALDAVILAGFPGTIASTWQQFGRAGRRADLSLGIMVASASPLDQYTIKHPAYILERSVEHALIDADNLSILTNHLKCAVHELPFEAGETFGKYGNPEAILTLLAEEGEIHMSEGVYRWLSDAYPASLISLRTAGSQRVIIQSLSDTGPEVIGEMDRESAPRMVHEGAVYLHENRQFLIDELDWERGIATASETQVDYYTNPVSNTSLRVIEEYETQLEGNCVRTHGRVMVSNQVTGYRMIRRYTHETLGYGEVSLPAQQYETTAYWITLTPDLTASLEQAQILLPPNDYGPNWEEQRNKARARDGYRCAHCGTEERDDRQHDVHHIRPFREFGYIAGHNQAYLEANQLDNLVTLCPSCHRNAEAAHRTRGALSGLANVLQNIAVLLVMCAPGDLGVQAENRSTYTGTPTITLYDHIPGGVGLSSSLYERHGELLKSALELVRDCECANGCPACVGPVAESPVETKALTLSLLEALTLTT